MDLKRVSHALPQSSGDGKVCKCVCVEWEETKKKNCLVVTEDREVGRKWQMGTRLQYEIAPWES